MSTVVVRDLSSNRIHLRFRVEGVEELGSFEACNADQAGEFEEVDESVLADIEPARLCDRCFPTDAA